MLKNLNFSHDIADLTKKKKRDTAATKTKSYNRDAVGVDWYILAKLKHK